jgi:hypothetical protein
MRYLFFLIIGWTAISTLSAQNFITPSLVTALTPELNETSGLINLDGDIWTHNDNGGDTEIYRIDLSDGSINRTVTVHDANNVDWEDIACDENYVYIGDFGNNDGSRTNLRIYRISRAEIAAGNDVDAEKIHFAYSDQTNFEPNYHNTNFDCEALVCFEDKLYLFTKNWIDNHTNLYELPKIPGTYIADYKGTFNVDCLITGAEIIPSLNTLLLSGYNDSGGTYTWIFNDYPSDYFFDGGNTRLIWTFLTQVEGICYIGNRYAYASSEKLPGILDPSLFSVNLSDYMTGFISEKKIEPLTYAEGEFLNISFSDQFQADGILQIMNIQGQVINQLNVKTTPLSIRLKFQPGVYLIYYNSATKDLLRKVVVNH